MHFVRGINGKGKLTLLVPAIAAFAFITSGGARVAGEPPPKLVTFKEVTAMSADAPTETIRYGNDAQQYGELRVPPGNGPFPVAIILHGGCWQAAIADLTYMNPAADALRKSGIATWNVEYRRVGNEGGGWPGTFLDVAHAADHLRQLADKHQLDLRRVIVIGHSAGGHLALWLAARSRLAGKSPLYMPNPLELRAVVSLAGIADLAAYASDDPDACGQGVIKLLGGKPVDFPARYDMVSPIALLPLRIPQFIIQGAHDRPVPPEFARAYLKAAQQAGDVVRYIELPDAGHFELVAPEGNTWAIVLDAIQIALAHGKS